MDSTKQTESEEEIARLLRAAGPRGQLPPELGKSWEQHFRAEFRQAQQRRKQRRLRIWASVAALIPLVAIAISLLIPGQVADLPEYRVVGVSGGVHLQRAGSSTRVNAPGSMLLAGDQVSVDREGGLALRVAGYDLRLRSLSEFRLQEGALYLNTGEIYISDRDDTPSSIQLVVHTPHGEIRDIGTQFTVAVSPESTVTTVRRGAVVVSTGRTEFHAQGQSGKATRVVLDKHAELSSEAVPATGWEWIYRVAPGYRIEGRSAHEFLQWAVLESGHRLQFANAAAKLRARKSTLHGSIEGMTPEQAVPPVLASAGLVARFTADTLLVELQP